MIIEFYGLKFISVELGVKLKSLSRGWNCRNLSLNTKKPTLLQDKLLDDHFAVLKMAIDELLTELILILTQIRVR